MFLDVLCRLTLQRSGLECEERTCLSHGENAVRDECLHLFREAQEADAVRDRRTAARDAARKLFL